MSGRARLTVCAVVAMLAASCALLSLTARWWQVDRAGVAEGSAGGGPVAGAAGGAGTAGADAAGAVATRGGVSASGTAGGARPVAASGSGAEA
ncbi:hypothetical protein SRIMHP_27935 [Streptomyces rimosus subsp. rimosus]|uniref:Lipoprotein n=1 Tax=Streptomyces rimosus subsp. rimosus TaxID=132474 RepID=A0ABY3Z869_STRRM|nr:hypothetical protein SRIMR7_30560 [Streptomyces rimosus subsp. rimosus]UTH97958.1 hypothetical protein SRIMHP_27935 [Streptomyces rimosus subsp. rimosus]UTJ16056.1 hypothetical protein SRIMDV3_27835 [Streptomyces rimosus subsp. rimosus]